MPEMAINPSGNESQGRFRTSFLPGVDFPLYENCELLMMTPLGG